MEPDPCPGTGGFGRIEWENDEGVWVTRCGACDATVPVDADGAVSRHEEQLAV